MTLCNGRDGATKCYEPCERYYLDDALPLIRGYCTRHTRQKVGTLVASHKAHIMTNNNQHIMAYGMHANLPSGMYCCAIGEDDIATAKRLHTAINSISVYREYGADHMDVDTDITPDLPIEHPADDLGSDSEAPLTYSTDSKRTDRPARPILRRVNATVSDDDVLPPAKRRKLPPRIKRISVLSDDDEEDSFVVDDQAPIIHESWTSDSDSGDEAESPREPELSDDEQPRRQPAKRKRYRTIDD